MTTLRQFTGWLTDDLFLEHVGQIFQRQNTAANYGLAIGSVTLPSGKEVDFLTYKEFKSHYEKYYLVRFYGSIPSNVGCM